LIWAALAAKPGTVATLGLRAAVGWEMTVSRILVIPFVVTAISARRGWASGVVSFAAARASAAACWSG
jgi:hypothetical protein